MLYIIGLVGNVALCNKILTAFCNATLIIYDLHNYIYTQVGEYKTEQEVRAFDNMTRYFITVMVFVHPVVLHDCF